MGDFGERAALVETALDALPSLAPEQTQRVAAQALVEAALLVDDAETPLELALAACLLARARSHAPRGRVIAPDVALRWLDTRARGEATEAPVIQLDSRRRARM